MLRIPDKSNRTAWRRPGPGPEGLRVSLSRGSDDVCYAKQHDEGDEYGDLLAQRTNQIADQARCRKAVLAICHMLLRPTSHGGQFVGDGSTSTGQFGP